MKLGFILKEAFDGFRRNVTITVAMIITTALSLALVATGLLLTSMTSETKEIYLDRIEVMVQLDDATSGADTDCSGTECAAIKAALDDNSDVESVTFRNKQQSYERFVELFKDTDPQLVAQTSPDAFPAALHIRLVDPLDTSAIDEVSDMPGVSTVVDQGDDLRGATRNLDAIRNASFILAIVQGLAAVLLIMNMVQMAAFQRRTEVSIMRMVGATRWYTQAPFVIEAMFAALAGSVLAVIGMLVGKQLILDKALASLYDSHLIARIDTADIWRISPLMVLGGIIVAALTAQVTLRWYVKK
ncbi:permease-like cell division protein FtsX [Corynebacterium terpenotabidum]|uniref:Cell division protein FtsX n=1 Tax=Corynebacterium terpenotabidum Y-11 TaxID=1200352 RepID=S4XAU8_9CORY|nr:permease-like cell division protein FtsX [Corynebacterium terpenotabidum]AGP30262.1 cell division protein FtsX [Corynebacterium terpenotabidum Y-11]